MGSASSSVAEDQRSKQGRLALAVVHASAIFRSKRSRPDADAKLPRGPRVRGSGRRSPPVAASRSSSVEIGLAHSSWGAPAPRTARASAPVPPRSSRSWRLRALAAVATIFPAHRARRASPDEPEVAEPAARRELPAGHASTLFERWAAREAAALRRGRLCRRYAAVSSQTAEQLESMHGCLFPESNGAVGADGAGARAAAAAARVGGRIRARRSRAARPGGVCAGGGPLHGTRCRALHPGRAVGRRPPTPSV